MLQSEINEYERSKRFSIGFVENAQKWGFYSVLIWVPAFYLMGDSLHWSYPVIHLLLAFLNDNWWGYLFRAHQKKATGDFEMYELDKLDATASMVLRGERADVAVKVMRRLDELGYSKY